MHRVSTQLGTDEFSGVWERLLMNPLRLFGRAFQSPGTQFEKALYPFFLRFSSTLEMPELTVRKNGGVFADAWREMNPWRYRGALSLKQM